MIGLLIIAGDISYKIRADSYLNVEILHILHWIFLARVVVKNCLILAVCRYF